MHYFQPEITPFTKQEWFPKLKKYGFNRSDWVSDISKPLPDDFYERRKEGENESEICQLIRKGLAKDFISYISKNNISLNTPINPSIYETNHLLVKKQIKEHKHEGIKLIEYASFFGSIEIVNYLIRENQELTPSLWLYAIHGQNAELLHILEENHILPEDETYTKCLNESIKCHNNDTANYFMNNLLTQEESVKNELEFNLSLKHYNFTSFQEKDINDFSICDLVEYDYFILLKNLLKNKDIDVNKVKLYDNKKDEKFEKTPIYLAIEKEDLEMIKLLLTNEKLNINSVNKVTELNIDSDEWNYYWYNNDDDFRFRETKETPIFLAIKRENIEIIKLLLSDKRSIDLNCLNLCVYKSIYEDDNEDIDSTDAFDDKDDYYTEENYGVRKYEKKTALFLAAEKQNLEIVKLLIENESIDPNVINIIRDQNLQETDGNDDYYNITVLYYLVSGHLHITLFNYDEGLDFEIMKLLLSNEKTDVNIINYLNKRNYEGGDCFIKNETALFAAVENEYFKYEYQKEVPSFDVIELLLTNKKIDLNIKCTHIELERDYDAFIKEEPEIRTPLEFASEKSFEAIVELFKKYQKWRQEKT